jgi:4-carboxymuconolactone decarboxylase
MLELPDPLRYDEDQRRVHERIAGGPRGAVRGPLALWLHSPELADRAQHLGEFLRFGTTLPPRLTELAILVVARHWACAYVWCVHEPIALKEGVEERFLLALAEDRDALPAAADDRVVTLFMRQLVQRGRPDDAIRGEVLQRFGARGCVELTAIAGYYTLGGFTLSCADLPLPGGATKPFSG